MTSGRKLPSWFGQVEGWALQQVLDSHLDAIYRLGEYSMFVLMWRAIDHEQGFVERCPVCVGEQERAFAAYSQPTRRDCPSCFGTTWEGGIRARIIRPALWTDKDANTSEGRRGEVVQSGMFIETTQDFSAFNGDYVFRVNGDRFQLNDLNATPIRTGFDVPDDPRRSTAGFIDQAMLEDISSVAYQIPPGETDLKAALALPAGGHLVPEVVSPWELVNGPLYRED